MKSSLELLGRTGIKLIGLRTSGRETGGTIGRIFTGFMKNSEPPATDVVDVESQNLGEGTEDVQKNRRHSRYAKRGGPLKATRPRSHPQNKKRAPKRTMRSVSGRMSVTRPKFALPNVPFGLA